jgi:hypothetical protein
MTHPNVVKAAMITESILLSAPYKSPEDKAPPRRIPSAIATIEQKIIRTKKLTRTLKFVSFSIFDRFEGVSPIFAISVEDLKRSQHSKNKFIP